MPDDQLATSDAMPARPEVAMPSTRRGRATREQLVSAAREVFSQAEFSAAKVTDITRAAGVATGSFYSYFAAKEDVFREVAMEVIDELTDAGSVGGDGPGRDVVRDIERTIVRYVDVATRHAVLTRSIQQVSHVDPELRRYRAARMGGNVARIERHVRQLQAQGLADPGLDAAIAAQVLQSMIISSVYDHLVLFEERLETERLVQMLTTVWLRTIGYEPR